MTLSYNCGILCLYITSNMEVELEKNTASETKLTLGQAWLYLSIVFNLDKFKRVEKFQRRGLGRRQDHGTRGNSDRGNGYPWFSPEEDAMLLSKRKDFRRGSMIELE